MKLFAYGDSWTEGQGGNLDEENLIKDRTVLQEFRNQYGWPKKLAQKLKCTYENKGFSGRANNLIFNDVISDLRYARIHKGDLVVIMWSSSLRDYVHFLPKGEWIGWSVKELLALPDKFFKSYKFGDEKYNQFLEEYKKFFLVNLFNQNYYNIINQNYIIFLQKMLDEYGVKYLMIDAFEHMTQNLNNEDDKTHLINKKTYLGFGHKTARDFLLQNEIKDVWELPCKNDVDIWVHPNEEGYNLISNYLYEYIHNNIL